MTSARAFCVNPSNQDQWYVLFANGNVASRSTAGVQAPPPVQGAPTFTSTSTGREIAIDLAITDWVTPGGYVMDQWGRVHEFGSALPVNPTVGGTQAHNFNYTKNLAWWRRFSMHPSGNGAGYQLSIFGQVAHFGGATRPPESDGNFTPLLSPTAAASRAFWINHSSRDFAVMDFHGDVRGDGPQETKRINLANRFKDMYYNPATGKGWTMDSYGPIYPLVGSQVYTKGGPSWHASAAARFTVLDEGLGANPLTFALLDVNGVRWVWQASTAPTTTINAPAEGGTITNTLRPEIAWGFSDPQGDGQQRWQAAILPSSRFSSPFFRNIDVYVLQNPTYPLLWAGREANRRGLSLTDDTDITKGQQLRDGKWRVYVRTQDTAEQWSPWDSNTFTVAIDQPWEDPEVTVEASPEKLDFKFSYPASPTSADVQMQVWYTDHDDAGNSVDHLAVEDDVHLAIAGNALRRSVTIPTTPPIYVTNYFCPSDAADPTDPDSGCYETLESPVYVKESASYLVQLLGLGVPADPLDESTWLTRGQLKSTGISMVGSPVDGEWFDVQAWPSSTDDQPFTVNISTGHAVFPPGVSLGSEFYADLARTQLVGDSLTDFIFGDPPQEFTLSYYEHPNGVNDRRYWTRTVQLEPLLEGRRSPNMAVTVEPDNKDEWWLLDPSEPWFNAQIAKGQELTVTGQNSPSTFKAVGRRNPIVPYDVEKGVEGDIVVYALSGEAWQNLQSLVLRPRRLVLKGPGTAQCWPCVIMSYSWKYQRGRNPAPSNSFVTDQWGVIRASEVSFHFQETD